MSGTFRSLKLYNYRLFFGGALVSNVGTWMQRTAQDWLVLTQLTDNDAVALGVVTALQFTPQLFLAPHAGLIADRFDKRKLLIVTQLIMMSLGFGLGALVLTNLVTLPIVYLFAAALGVVASYDAPARQAFVSELVGPSLLSNAVALNSASFNGARLFGPAVSGLLTAAIGTGWVFIVNGFTFAGTIVALLLMRESELNQSAPVKRGKGQLRAGFSYVRHRGDLLAIFVVIFIVSAFGMNFPVFAATMTSKEFGLGSDWYGYVSSATAIGSLTGALIAARAIRPRWRTFVTATISFGVFLSLASLAPSVWWYLVAVIPVGLSSITMLTTANSLVQTTTPPALRGRVMSLYMAVLLGATPIGSPVIGWVSNAWGPRAGILIGGLMTLVAGIYGLVWMVRNHNLHIEFRYRFIPRFRVDGPDDRTQTIETLASREAGDRRQ